MTGYFRKALGAELRAGRGLLLLTVLGVALGVGSVLSIRILDQGALGAFEGTVRAVSGDAALTVVGSGPTFPRSSTRPCWPTREWPRPSRSTRTEASVEGGPPLFLEVLGVDLLAPVRLPVQGARGAGRRRARVAGMGRGDAGAGGRARMEGGRPGARLGGRAAGRRCASARSWTSAG